MSSALTVTKIIKSYGDKVVLDKLSFEANPGEFIVLVGPSGCGKSTLFNVISQLDQPTTGTVIHTGRLAMMFQDPALLPWLTVDKNVAFGLDRKKYSKSEMSALVKRYLKIAVDWP